MPEAGAQKDRSPRSRPATVPSADVLPPTKRLPQEDIDKSCNRLHSSFRKTRDLPPLVARRSLTKEQEESSVRRLYDQAVLVNKRRQEELEKKVHAQSGLLESKKLDEPEITDAVNRLYLRSMEHKLLESKKLDEKYAPPSPTKRLSKEAQAEVNERTYDKARDHKRETKSKLYEKYVLEHLPKVPKRSEDQWKETSSRLYAKP
jgi:hypothetical protein